jgi:acyl carrier protein
MVDVAKRVIEIISGRVPPGRAPIELSDALDSLGLASLDVLELTFAIEEKFNIEIPFNANSKLQHNTVGELVGEVERLVAQQTDQV